MTKKLDRIARRHRERQDRKEATRVRLTFNRMREASNAVPDFGRPVPPHRSGCGDPACAGDDHGHFQAVCDLGDEVIAEAVAEMFPADDTVVNTVMENGKPKPHIIPPHTPGWNPMLGTTKDGYIDLEPELGLFSIEDWQKERLP
jgi:hypothetical protein